MAGKRDKKNRIIQLSISDENEDGWYCIALSEVKYRKRKSETGVVFSFTNAPSIRFVIGRYSYKTMKIECFLEEDGSGRRNALVELSMDSHKIRASEMYFAANAIGLYVNEDQFAEVELSEERVIEIRQWLEDVETLTWDWTASG